MHKLQRITPQYSLVILLATFAATAAAAEAEQKTLRVYHVGNSVTDTIKYNALLKLAAAAGHEYIYGRHMIPGAPLAWIWKHPDQGFKHQKYGYYPEALTEHEWDVLTLQPFDRQLEGGDESDLVVARRYIDLALKKSPKLQVYVYQRWPRRDEPEKGQYKLDYAAKWNRKYTGGWDGTNETRDYFERLTQKLRDAYPKVEKPILIVPVGDVMLELDRRMQAGQVPGYKNIGELYSDGIHMGNVGSYVVGCTFFATLFRESPVGLPGEPYGVNDPETAKALQQAVWDVVSKHPLAGVAADSTDS